MAEVIPSWPAPQRPGPAQFVYPWSMWARLDRNGHGDIWLAEQGVDFPEDMVPVRFRSVLYNRATRETKKLEKNAPLKLMRVKGTNRVKRIPDYEPLRVKVVIVSPELVAFQFFQGEEPPIIENAPEVAIPRRRPLHARKNRRTLEMVGA